MRAPAFILALLLALVLPGAAGAQIAPPSRSDAGGATAAYSDMISRFWRGPPASGHLAIVNGIGTGNSAAGVSIETPPQKGWLWQYAQAWNVIYAEWKITGSADALTRLGAERNWVLSIWTPANAATCGAVGGTTSYAQDDATWGAMGLVELYDATGDANALALGAAIIDCAYNRWYDTTMGGGLFYTDSPNAGYVNKDSYNGEFALAMVECAQFGCSSASMTNSQMMANGRALADWGNATLLRGTGTVCPQSDALYHMGVYSNAGVTTPIENACAHPGAIAAAASVTQLSNNMAFAAVNARLYALTGVAAYKTFAVNTAASILALELDGNGAFLDDRDARTNGFAAWNMANDVVPLLANPQPMIGAFLAALRCVSINARNPDGGYVGDWCGPLNGTWTTDGFNPDELEVAANAAIWPIAALLWAAH